MTVTDGGSTTITFALHAASAILEQVVVTGTATATQTARENGAAIGIISVDSISQAPITNFSELLNSRDPGLQVLQNSGTVGTGSRIEIRGVSTTGVGAAALQSQPVVVIDGVRAYNDVRGFSDLGGLGGQFVSRFDDIDHEDIADIQVLKGPAAAALYGTQAANGVIVIQTRHGEANETPRWHVFGDLGRMNDVTTYPANYTRAVGTAAGDDPFGIGSCSLTFEFEGACTPANGALGATKSTNFNLVNSSPTFVNGYDEGTGASVTGGGNLTTYFVGANWDRQQGVYHNNQDRWTHLNFGLGLHPYSRLDLGITAQYTQRRTVLPLGDNAIGGILTGELLGGAGPKEYFAGLSPQVVQQLDFNTNADRFTLGSNGTLRILPWLSATGTVGVDYLGLYDNFYESQLVVPQLQPTGLSQAANNAIFVYTGSASLSGKFSLGSSFNTTTTFGGEWVDESLRQAFASGEGLLPGTNDVSGATSNFSATEVNTDVVNIGGYLQELVGWRNVLFLTAAARLDGNSAFGTQHSTALYPSASVSYNISDERYWKQNPIISSLRFRAAGGQSGREPLFRQAAGSYVGTAYNVFEQGSVSGAIANTYANINLKPERTTEYETGVDIGLFKERFTLTATAYDKFTTDLVQTIPLDIATGVGPGPTTSVVYANIGKVDNRGLELSLNGNIFRSEPVTIGLNTTFALNANKLTNSGTNTAVPLAFGVSGAALQQDVNGAPIGAYYATKYTYKDANHDGIIEPSELTLASTSGALTEIGSAFPRDEFSISPTVTLFRYFKFNALFDRRDGFYVYDGTDAFRCQGGFQVGRDCNDPTAPLQNQAASLALNGLNGNPSEYGYLGNGSFWKFREVNFTLSAPQTWANRYLGGHGASITVSGRNLATWTNYRGLDPEINQNGSDAVATSQFFTQPPIRTWIGRVDLTW